MRESACAVSLENKVVGSGVVVGFLLPTERLLTVALAGFVTEIRFARCDFRNLVGIPTKTQPAPETYGSG